LIHTAILCYHSFSETWRAATNVTPGGFERQLAWFVEHGYRALTLTEAITDGAGRRDVVFTFDDAHRSVLNFAAPLMKSAGFVGTVFPATRYVDSGEPMGWDGYDMWLGTPDEHELTPMSWDELGALMEDGWEVGSHTVTHPHLPEIADDEELAAELEESRQRIVERLGVPSPALAYPYGHHDARVRRAAGEAGYTLAVTIPQRAEPPLPLAWPRVGVYLDDDVRRLRMRVWRRFLPLRTRFGARALERVLSLRGG
jgi:peptidoglycan/xylan/chitin deacetylase (PgdA/CDA1 family)